MILREVSPNATEADVVFLFADLNVKEVRKDMGNFFVVFETEEDAVEAVFGIRGKELDGQPVRARVKSEGG